MKYIMDKISSYNIVNYLVPGTIFAVLAQGMTSISLVRKNLLIALCLNYVLGLIISEIGSLILEPLLKKINFIRFAPYTDYVVASTLDPKIEILSEQNNMYRALCSLAIILIPVVFYNVFRFGLEWVTLVMVVLVLMAFLILFLFSYRKQTQNIVRRIEIAKAGEQE